MLRAVLLLAAVSASTPSVPHAAAHGPAGYIAVTVGDLYACGISTANDAYCWGQDRSGVLGGPATTTCGSVPCSPTPQLIPGGIKFRLIAAGAEHVCGISLTKKAYCWGSNTRGQLGIGDPTVTSSYWPKNVAIGHYFDTLSTGWTHTCARAADTAATFCWGDNRYLQLGNPVAETCFSSPVFPCSTKPVPVITSETFLSVQAGMFTSCGLAWSGKVYCWGSNQMLGLGDGTTSTSVVRYTPAPIAGGRMYAGVTDGATHACAIEPSGAAWCWGNNAYVGQLGDGTATNSPVPVAVATSVPFLAISASHGNSVYTHSCALDTSGAAYCWGSNSSGQLGVASAPATCALGPCATTPVAASGGLALQSISTGLEETCALAPGGQAYCWGRNNAGQLGDGTTVSSSLPVPVLPPP